MGIVDGYFSGKKGMRGWWCGVAMGVMVMGAGWGMGGEEKGELSGGVLREGGRDLIEYRYEQVPFKPYIKHLYSPGGVDVLRDMVPDHPHHHGLMFGVRVNDAGFWEESAKGGKEVHRGELGAQREEREGVVRMGFTESLEWVGAGAGRPVVREVRRIDCYRVAEVKVTLVSWRSTIRAAEEHGEITLGGSHYYGLGMRFAKSMDQAGEFFTAKGKIDGEVVRGDERLTKGEWCAVYGTVEGKGVTVAMFDHPGNVRKALWFTMSRPFSYLSATLNYFREPLRVKEGEALSLCYGVGVWDGRVESSTVEKGYRRWVEVVKLFEKAGEGH